MTSLFWLGDDAPYLDQPHVVRSGNMVLGCYGGNTSAGASKNEDAGALVNGNGWRLAVVLDAHTTAESAALLIDELQIKLQDISQLLNESDQPFEELRSALIQWFTSAAFRESADSVEGESSFLLCAEKQGFIFWFSVGDCLAYLLHPDLTALGQFTLNQRSFFEWIGKRNSFALPVPAFSSGVKQLRPGTNLVLLATDGLFEGSESPFVHPEALVDRFSVRSSMEESLLNVLSSLHDASIRDSATVIAWWANGV